MNEQSDDHTDAATDSEMDEYDRAPDEFESDITVEDATVPEHPVIVEVAGKGEASARLVKQRTLETLRDEAADENEIDNFGHEAIVRVLKDHYVSPSFENLTVKKYKDSPAGYYDPFFDAIVPEMTEMGN